MSDLPAYILAGYPCILLRSAEDDRVIEYINTVLKDVFTGHDEYEILTWSCTYGLSGAECTTELCSALNAFKQKRSSIGIFLNAHLFFDDPKIIQAVKDTIQEIKATGSHLIFIGPWPKVPLELDSIVTTLDYPLPSPGGLKKLFQSIFDDYDIKIKDLESLVQASIGMTETEAENALALSFATNYNVATLRKEKIRAINKSEILEVVEFTDTIDSFGDFDNLKEWLRLRKKAFSVDAENYGLSFPKGILLIGPGGTGKSYVSRGIADYLGLPLIKMDAGRIFKKYVGDSETLIRDALKIIERISPVVLLIDEVSRFFIGAENGNDAGVSPKILATLLTWMQERTCRTFIVATTNELTLPAPFYRSRRFDRIFATDIPGLKGRGDIFKIHLRKRKRDPENYNIAALSAASIGFTGAEIEQAIEDAMYLAFPEEFTTIHLLSALKDVIPMSIRDAEKIRLIREFCQKYATPVYKRRVLGNGKKSKQTQIQSKKHKSSHHNWSVRSSKE